MDAFAKLRRPESLLTMVSGSAAYNPEDMSLNTSPVFDGSKSDKLIAPRKDDRPDGEGTGKKGRLDVDSKKGPESKKGNKAGQHSVRVQSALWKGTSNND